MKDRADRTAKLTGIVDVLERDEHDEDLVAAIQIVTLDEDDYLVADSSAGDELFDLIGELVEVEGIVSEDEHGDKMITVRRCTVLDRQWDA